MRILFIFFGLLCKLFFSCLSMEKTIPYGTPNYNSAIAEQQENLLQKKQSIITQAIILSMEVAARCWNNLATTIASPPEYEANHLLVLKSLDTLTNYLNNAHALGFQILLNPMNYNWGNNNETHAFFGVSTAIDFLHVPLLIACKKHANMNGSKFDVSLALCFEETKKTDALTKCNNRIAKCFERLSHLNVQNDPGNKIGSYLATEWYTLSKIMNVLTIPTCYE